MEFRSARHTNNLNSIVEFYTIILGLEVLFSFDNHNDYCGAFLGKPDHQWHIEFTMSKTTADHKFDPEDILVFYPTNKKEYDEIIQRIEINNLEKLIAKNPFWNDNGIMVKDPDDFRVVISNMKVN